jgi:hypothetical protein
LGGFLEFLGGIRVVLVLVGVPLQSSFSIHVRWLAMVADGCMMNWRGGVNE